MQFGLFCLAQLWRYNPETMIMENKNGNWKFLHRWFTQLPKDGEKDGMNIEAWHSDHGEVHRQVLVLRNDNKSVDWEYAYPTSDGELVQMHLQMQHF